MPGVAPLNKPFVANLSRLVSITAPVAAAATSPTVACSIVFSSFFKRSLRISLVRAATYALGIVTAATMSGTDVIIRSAIKGTKLSGLAGISPSLVLGV